MNEDFLKIEKLSTEVLRLSRNTILINLRFMSAALAELEFVPTLEMPGIATDGTSLIYNPMDILRMYAEEKYLVNRNYLHVLLHCLYRHNFVNNLLDEATWDLACDIAIENIINELSVSSFEASRARNQVAVLSELENKIKILTAEKIYRYYLDKKISDSEIEKIRKNFFADDHSLWYQEESASPSCDIDDDTDENDDSPDNSGQDGSNGNDDSQDNVSQDDSGKEQKQTKEERWREISELIQQDLETFSKDRGDTAGSLFQNLCEVNREKYDYTSFLKKFAVMGEAMKINDDEFDYVFYTYGLKLYKKMPLIEPLEYKDVKRIREFAIVIDTSGSVCGELVQTFINKTYNILKNTESFFSKINLYIIQCDAEIQDVKKITSQDEFDDYINNISLRGFGGTDFRPAFELVNKLVESGELSRLKGLIYFTDGWGEFPKKKPPYDAAFVFIRQDFFNPDVPPWAIKLVLDEEDI